MSAKVAIGVTAWNRPSCLRDCLASLALQMHGADWPVFLHVDGEGGREKEIRALAAASGLSIQVRVERQNLGVNLNTYGTMQWIWDEGYNWAVYLEDDLVLSPDALRLAAWYIGHAAEIEVTHGVDYIGAYCLCTRGGGTNPTEILLSRALIAWGFVMSREQFKWVEPAWLSGEKDTPPSMWDRHIARRVRGRGPHAYNCIPTLSRILNIGREGIHYTPERWRRDTEGMVAGIHAAEYEYKVAGWDEPAREHQRALGLVGELERRGS